MEPYVGLGDGDVPRGVVVPLVFGLATTRPGGIILGGSFFGADGLICCCAVYGPGAGGGGGVPTAGPAAFLGTVLVGMLGAEGERLGIELGGRGGAAGPGAATGADAL